MYEYLCSGDTLYMAAFLSGATYRWCTGARTAGISITEGNQFYSVTVTLNNCPTTDSVFIEERPKPMFRLPNDTAICLGSKPIIQAIGIGANDADFLWTNGSEHLSMENWVEATEAGIYILTTEKNNCVWSDSVRLHERFCDKFELPTAFRPNSQVLVNEIYVNRVFKPIQSIPEGLVVYEMFIYDSWGNLMFQSNDPKIGWNGTDFNGRDAQPGVFVYVIKAYETVYGNDISTHGSVALIR
jgi:hypothetical protein